MIRKDTANYACSLHIVFPPATNRTRSSQVNLIEHRYAFRLIRLDSTLTDLYSERAAPSLFKSGS